MKEWKQTIQRFFWTGCFFYHYFNRANLIFSIELGVFLFSVTHFLPIMDRMSCSSSNYRHSIRNLILLLGNTFPVVGHRTNQAPAVRNSSTINYYFSFPKYTEPHMRLALFLCHSSVQCKALNIHSPLPSHSWDNSSTEVSSNVLASIEKSGYLNAGMLPTEPLTVYIGEN